MLTRSKTREEQREEIFYDCVQKEELVNLNVSEQGTLTTSSSSDSLEDIDEHGNLRDLIDDSGVSEGESESITLNLESLLGTRLSRKPKKSKKGKKKGKSVEPESLMSLLLPLLVLKANAEMSNRQKLKRKHSPKKADVLEEISEESDDEREKSEESEESEDIQLTDEEEEIQLSEDSEEEEDEEDEDEEDESESEEELESEEESEDEEYSFEYDKLDEEYEEILEKHASVNTEEHDMEYYHYLGKEKKTKLMQETKDIYKYSASDVPLRFKVVESEMDLKTKAIAMENIDKLRDMDVSTGEHSKMDHWINGLLKIPFGKYKELAIKSDDPIEDKRTYIRNAYQTLNKAIYGHKEAKTHILQVIGKWIKNPQSGGNVLAIQGPMGNGKTTLVKEGISKVLDRPFAFIALGGASDSAYFDGHCYTYEGSNWGRIVQILQEAKCMNPVFYFDELDKVSETQKGEEIIHMLTHLTDSSQNSLFQDNYFPGVNIDLSKALFIFSYNDESKVNKILKDRMYVIHTKGFSSEDKLNICRDYLIPEIYGNYDFKSEDIVFTDEILKHIIQTYTGGEEGVRNLKRCIETIVSKTNIYMLTYDKTDPSSTSDLSFQIKHFALPFQINRDHVETLLAVKKTDAPPFHMYV
tara:strand:+ start:6220 stop:8139 length:1920 start_codon:yes stop_codon:yes gene_type:complete